MSLKTKPPSFPLTSSRFTAPIERRVLQFTRKRDVLRKRERVLVAVSGGPDSSALLLVLARLSSALDLKLTVAHFNHMLRGEEEAAADLKFVRSLTSTLDLPLVHGSGDVRARARRNHESLEDAARRLRYAFLAEQAALAGATCVVTGHTMDDQAETVLLHLIRGAGLDGLAGMRPRSPWPFGAGPDLARPLLCLSREDSAGYSRESGIEPRQDPTNVLLVASRNKIRHIVLPELHKLNPRVVQAIGRLAQSVAEDADYLDDLARHHFSEFATTRGQDVRIPRHDIMAVGPVLTNRWIRLASEKLIGPDAGLEAAHIDAVREIAEKGHGTVGLPRGLNVTATSRSLIFHRGQLNKASPITETPLTVPGAVCLDQSQIAAQLVPVPAGPQLLARPLEAYLDPAKTGRKLTVRSRRPGDRLRPLGLGGEKKLQDILVDAKVPAAERDGIPLICGPEGIIWVAGHCIDERYALTPNSPQALHLTASPITDNQQPTTDN